MQKKPLFAMKINKMQLPLQSKKKSIRKDIINTKAEINDAEQGSSNFFL